MHKQADNNCRKRIPVEAEFPFKNMSLGFYVSLDTSRRRAMGDRSDRWSRWLSSGPACIDERSLLQFAGLSKVAAHCFGRAPSRQHGAVQRGRAAMVSAEVEAVL